MRIYMIGSGAMGSVYGGLLTRAGFNVTLIDPRLEWTVDPARFLSMSRNTPFAGRKLRCRAVRTVVGGRSVWQAPQG